MGIIDLSHYQGTIDWAQADPAIDGAYVKTTEGTTFVDPDWSAYHAGCVGGGKPVGAYHFADSGDPVAEANHFADQYLLAAWQLHPVLDAEIAKLTAAWIVAFRAQFRARVPALAFRVYAPVSLLKAGLAPAGYRDPNTTIWAAEYAATLAFADEDLVIWQNSDAARIPGVLGNVDSDQYCNGWTPAADGAAPPVPPAPPAPAPAGKIPAGTILRRGSTGAYVKDLQAGLNRQYPAYSHLVVDGVYGPATEACVREFQTRAHLQVDGIAGPQTLGALYLLA